VLLSSLCDENRSRKTALRTLLLALRANRRDEESRGRFFHHCVMKTTPGNGNEVETEFFAWLVEQVMDGRAALAVGWLG